MSDDRPDDATQETRPAKGEPVEIPIPERDEFFGNLEKVAKKPDQSSS